MKRLKPFNFFSSDEDTPPSPQPGTSSSFKRIVPLSSSESDQDLPATQASEPEGLDWNEPHTQFGPKPRDGRKHKKKNGRKRQKILAAARADRSEEEVDPVAALKSMTDAKVFEKIALPMDEFLTWLTELGLLPRERKCPLCESVMSPKFDKRRNYPSWRCPKKACKRKETGYFKGSFFKRLQCTPQEIMKLVWKWSQRETHCETLQKNFTRDDDSTISQQTIADWKSYLREVCMIEIANVQKPIGGENVCVMIDESIITKRKYNRGELKASDQWFLGAVDTSEQCWIVPVNGRSKEDLVPHIVQNVLPGSILVTDCWAAYTSLCRDYPAKMWRHFTCNHSDREHPFKDQETGACTNRIEGLWGHFKVRHKNERGTHRSLLLSHTAEFIWRKRYKEHPFFHIIRCIKNVYSDW